MLPTSTTSSTARDYARAPMTAVLYAIPGVASLRRRRARAAAQGDGVPARRADPRRCSRLPQRAALRRAHRAGRSCSPTARSSSGSRAIMRELDARAPEPPLLPVRPRRARARRARRGVGRPGAPAARAPRHLGRAAPRARARSRATAEGARLPVPRPLVAPQRAARRAARADGSTALGDPMVRADLSALPPHLDRVDGWIADGVAGRRAAPNAADLQIAASLRLLLTIEDLAPAARRPPGAARSPGACSPTTRDSVPAGALPAAWLRGGRVDAGAAGAATSSFARTGTVDTRVTPWPSRDGGEDGHRHAVAAADRALAAAAVSRTRTRWTPGGSENGDRGPTRRGGAPRRLARSHRQHAGAAADRRLRARDPQRGAVRRARASRSRRSPARRRTGGRAAAAGATGRRRASARRCRSRRRCS